MKSVMVSLQPSGGAAQKTGCVVMGDVITDVGDFLSCSVELVCNLAFFCVFCKLFVYFCKG